ncbi:cupin domain-containing protein [Fibrisoma montanum]|uniref:Cupin domain-containing protein n=1 Tax=Fibrisoma montanum TaxID=2305895 RepID=A0A418MJP6_9BACT|nr:cupin domain-containing protein [Fibrisoma montanum]RIV27561.1 cupin domain-containing protein [Fibrisoma montanum]
MNAAYWVNAFGMQPHPEGGYYAETYRSSELLPKAGLPDRFSGSRSVSTAIYFLLESHHVSALHRIQSDEVWHFYAGGPLEVFVIEPATGNLSIIRLGADPDQGEVFQAVVPAGSWFGSKPAAGTAYSLVGCTVAPGFDFADFELAKPEEMLQQFPQHRAVIELLS